MMRNLFVIFGMAVSLFLTGCLGQMAEQSQRSQDGLAEATFDTYSQLAGAEAGIMTIEVENAFPEPALLKVTMVEHSDAWKIFEIPAQDTKQIDLGSMEYSLQLIDRDTGDREGNEMLVSGDVDIVITSSHGSQFEIFTPDVE